jgi:non-canonical purine NTP pyrophosphatase (RdgB/HAM1 family)
MSKIFLKKNHNNIVEFCPVCYFSLSTKGEEYTILQEFYFVTGNSGKFNQLHALVEPLGITLQQIELDIIEPQADSVAEIATSKAEQAFKILQKPLVVEDSGLYIDALYGLPGPYIKYMNTHLSLEQILDIMHGKENRACYWVSTLAYADETGHITTFEDDTEKGTLAEEIHPDCHSDKARSQFWKIYISGNSGKPLAALTEEEYAQHMETMRQHSPFMRFTKWLEQHQQHVA